MAWSDYAPKKEAARTHAPDPLAADPFVQKPQDSAGLWGIRVSGMEPEVSISTGMEFDDGRSDFHSSKTWNSLSDQRQQPTPEVLGPAPALKAPRPLPPTSAPEAPRPSPPALAAAAAVPPPAAETTLRPDTEPVQGKCNEQDLLRYTRSGFDGFDKDMQDCSVPCLATSACTASCIANRDYTKPCARCFGDLAWCTGSRCAFQCMFGNSQGCRDCAHQTCRPSFQVCSGFKDLHVDSA